MRRPRALAKRPYRDFVTAELISIAASFGVRLWRGLTGRFEARFHVLNLGFELAELCVEPTKAVKMAADRLENDASVIGIRSFVDVEDGAADDAEQVLALLLFLSNLDFQFAEL